MCQGSVLISATLARANPVVVEDCAFQMEGGVTFVNNKVLCKDAAKAYFVAAYCTNF